MIKEINTLKPDMASRFLSNCTIEEKIDAHYVSAEIIDSNHITFRKKNKKAMR